MGSMLTRQFLQAERATRSCIRISCLPMERELGRAAGNGSFPLVKTKKRDDASGWMFLEQRSIMGLRMWFDRADCSSTSSELFSSKGVLKVVAKDKD